MGVALSPKDVREIRKAYKLELVNGKYKATNVIELAKRYNVTQETIRRVAKQHRHGWVND